ncbi:hypothetical protein C7999DRAFT_41054 [Corynascus novoguineensis]|uniref:BZIP domain-containing protein n=1 Tax=Corynascus novoguineensis TaxID=1126955 RepID=A0AAN7HJ51_9PEZI|nr:hypothetical protein C7999DRAFT_41054 [Corynascus novoguineensis]
MRRMSEDAALVSLPSSTTSPRYAPSCDLLQPSLSHDFDLLNDVTWDQAATSTFDSLVDPASITAATALSGADAYSNFSSPELDFDLAPCLDAFATPLFNFFPAPSTSFSLPAPPLTEVTTSVSNTPSTTNFQSPSPSPPGQDGDHALIPGLKLPRVTKPSCSRPGRRPAAATSLSRTADGRINKRGNNINGASAAAAAAASVVSADDEVDPEILDRRHRNNLAAKRYRQKKIDRIEELEREVKEVKQERDDLRIQLARQEAEVAALREMLKMKNSERSKD